MRSPLDWSRPRQLWLAIAVAALLLLPLLGTGSLRNWDEGIYAACSCDMHARGEWLTSSQQGEFWPNKPPVYFILTRVIFYLCGVNEWAVRLPAALCGVACVGLTFLLADALWGGAAGLCAAAVLLSTQQFLFYATQGQLDVPLACFVILALYAFWRGRAQPRYFLLSGIASALAFLTKQVLGWMAWPIIILFIAASGEWRHWWNRWMLAGVLVSVLLPAAWTGYEYHVYEAAHAIDANRLDGSQFLDAMYRHHVTQRLSAGVESSAKPWHYYLTDVMLKRNKAATGLAVLALALLCVARSTGRLEFARPEWKLAGIALFGILLFFMAAASQAKWYLLPLYPVWAVAVGGVLSQYIGVYRRFDVFLALLVALVGTTALSRQMWDHDFNPGMRELAGELRAATADEPSYYIFNPPETEPALGFYAYGLQGIVIRDANWEQAVAMLAGQIDRHPPGFRIMIVSRRAVWTRLQQEALADRLTLRREYPARDPDESLCLLEGKR